MTSQYGRRTPESTPKMPDPKNAQIFIQTVLANFYPKFGPCLRQTQNFRLGLQKPVNLTMLLVFLVYAPSLEHQFLPKCFLGLSLQTQFSFRFWRSHFAPKKPNFIQTCHESNNSEAGTFVNRDSVVDKFCFIEITDLPQESQFKL